MHWRDLVSADDRWLGLELEVRRGERPDKPRWRLEAATPLRLRVVAGSTVRLWARVDDWWDNWEALVTVAPLEPVIGPLAAPLIRRINAAPGSEAWWRAWARALATRLSEATCSPLYPGRWRLTPLLPRSTSRARAGLAPPPFVMPDLSAGPVRSDQLGDYSLVPLRAPSEEHDGRVKAWRKRARDGTLPPVVVLWVSALDLFLVLDGHDRLHAASLEGVHPRCLALWPVELRQRPVDVERQQAVWRGFEEALADPRRRHRLSVGAINETLLQVFNPTEERSVPRVWRIPGGRARWSKEVRARLRQLGLEPDTSDILAPLTADRRTRRGRR